LTPLNPNEQAKTHVYVFNQIFFSFAVDTPTVYNDSTTLESSPSFTQANHDVLGLQQLSTLDIEGLHLLATCLVTYRGHRVICQSIIPGILNNSDLTSMAEYGAVEEKKNIVANEHFHALMLKVAETFGIQTNKVVDPSNNKEIEIAGSVEVKGLCGSDKRRYVVDLQGLTPRDANYVDETDPARFHTCLVRPELISLYQRTKNMLFAQEHMVEFNKNLEAAREPEQKPVEGEELTND